MFEAMAAASRGDDVYAEDDTTEAFQARMAKLAGKEAALFAVSVRLAVRHLRGVCRGQCCYSGSLILASETLTSGRAR